MRLQTIIERHWYLRIDPILMIILFPFSLIYEIAITLRKILFTLRLIPSAKISVPVVIIGNITVGGAGKTPLTKHIASELQQQNIKFGIILRGYKSTTKSARLVNADDNSLEVGDEALIYAQAGFKVAIGSKRINAAKLLLQTYPDIQIILADDGMQHYYLRRDMEICVVDSSRMFGNQQLLPLGPLREPMERLKKVTAIVINGNYNREKLNEILLEYKTPKYYQHIQLTNFYNPVLNQYKSIEEMSTVENIMAVAGIGNPGRFYDTLDQNGIKIQKVKSFPDHYHYQANDISDKYEIITTEKDYTKLAQFKLKNVWIAQVSAQLNSSELVTQIVNLIHP